MSTSSRYPLFLAILILAVHANADANGTVCILSAPQAGNLQQQQPFDQRSLTQQQLTDQLNPSLTPSIPPIFRSDDPRYNLLPNQLPVQRSNFFDRQPTVRTEPLKNTSSSFWDQPINSSGSRNQLNGNQSPSSSNGYLPADPLTQQQVIPIQYDPNRPGDQPSPGVYDRSGFRREPLHPTYNKNQPQDQRIPSLVPSDDASLRSGGAPNDARRQNPDPWSRFTTPSAGRDQTTTPVSSFFDPTRRPKTSGQREQVTTRKPFYNRKDASADRSGNKNPSSSNQSQVQNRGRYGSTQIPQLTKELTTRTPGTRPVERGGSSDGSTNNNPQPVDVIPGPVDPSTQSVPEYAYIKQPISKVLDQPDLELEGKPVKFGILKDALDRVGLLELMSQTTPVTIFAPTDDAFLKLDPETLTRMQQNPNFLRNTMLRHIVNFDMPPDSLRNNIIVPSYSGEPLIVNVVNNGKLMLVKGTPIIAATNTQNGVIYVISKVMTEETTSATVLEELAIMPDTSIFYQYISRSTHLRRLQGQGPFTILAPNNTAFEKLPAATRQVLDYNPIVLEKLLSFHILEGAIFKKELETSETIPSGAGRVEPLKLRSQADGSITVNEVSSVTKADISTGNGVVHVINTILFPAELVATFRKIEARSLFNAGRSALTGSVAGGSSQLQRDQPYVNRPQFGFTSSSSPPTDSNNNARRDRSFPQDRSANYAVRSGGRSSLNNQNDLASEAAPRSKDDESSVRFYRWIQKSGFLDVLNNTGNNYTVILPIDRAVNRLPLKYQEALETNSRQLESLLMYHIIPGVVNVSRLKDEDTIPTVSGKDVRFNRLVNSSSNSNSTSNNNNNASTNDASTRNKQQSMTRDNINNRNANNKRNTTSQQQQANVTFSGATMIGSEASPNGKITFILVDRVMYPPQGNLFDVIANSPILKSLANLIKVAGLESGLSDTGPFTLFAPSDEAFQKLPLESIEYLSHDPQSSRAFLLRHIIRPVMFTSAIPIGNSSVIESTTGDRLQVTREKDVVKVDGVGIRYADITATNGVIHVIDHVL